MIPSIRSVDNYIEAQKEFFICNDNWLIYALISIVMAIAVIIVTLWVVRIVEMSSILNFIMFGIKPKNERLK